MKNKGYENCFFFFFGGGGGPQTRRIMGDVQVAYERFQLINTLHQDI